jgi:hypothetical protein
MFRRWMAVRKSAALIAGIAAGVAAASGFFGGHFSSQGSACDAMKAMYTREGTGLIDPSSAVIESLAEAEGMFDVTLSTENIDLRRYFAYRTALLLNAAKARLALMERNKNPVFTKYPGMTGKYDKEDLRYMFNDMVEFRESGLNRIGSLYSTNTENNLSYFSKCSDFSSWGFVFAILSLVSTITSVAFIAAKEHANA